MPPLKLRAVDSDDLEVFSALLQDALVPLVDVAFQKRDRRFVMVANRFKWAEASGTEVGDDSALGEPEGDARFEDADEPPLFERINCGIVFDRVLKVRSIGIDRDDKKQILSLLAIKGEPGRVTLFFAGGGRIQLDVSAIYCHMEDVGESWPTRWHPSHERADPADQAG